MLLAGRLVRIRAPRERRKIASRRRTSHVLAELDVEHESGDVLRPENQIHPKRSVPVRRGAPTPGHRALRRISASRRTPCNWEGVPWAPRRACGPHTNWMHLPALMLRLNRLLLASRGRRALSSELLRERTSHIEQNPHRAFSHNERDGQSHEQVRPGVAEPEHQDARQHRSEVGHEVVDAECPRRP